MLKIAVVGAGSAGMAMAKQVQDQAREDVEIVLFERRGEVGGIWQYDHDIEPGRLAWEYDDGSLSEVVDGYTKRGRRLRYVCQSAKTRRQPGPMFDGLRTNIPNDLMTYRDSPFREGTHLFPSRGEVQSYLEDYASRHSLRKYVRFNTSVKRIAKDGSATGWIVHSESAIDGVVQARTETFSHLVLAHGRCKTPNIPQIEGIETFNGRVIHSAWYRDPATIFQPGEPRRVLVVGNASSGMDIARELSGYIKRSLPGGKTAEQWEQDWQKDPIEVFSSWHSPEKPPPMDYNPQDPTSPEWCRRINVVHSIASIEGDTIKLADDSTLADIPLIIFATGYLFDCPFLDQSKGILRQYPLLPPSTDRMCTGFPSSSMYNMDDWLLMHSQDESLAVLGLPITVVPFPFGEIQALYVINRWLGKAVKLPLLDTSLGVDDELRWTSRRAQSSHVDTNGFHSTTPILNTTAHVFGTPSDHTYLDQLLTFCGAGQAPPWLDHYSSDGLGNGEPRGPEALFRVSPWRRERRSNGRILRRATLGY